MPDTPRTAAALLTLFADNTAGDISAQDLRDFVVSVMTRTKRVYLPAPMFTQGAGAALANVGSSANAYEDSPAWAFDAASDEHINLTMMMPLEWDGGAITPIIHWAPSNTDTGNVRWQILWGDIAATDQIDEAGTTITQADAGDGVADARQTISLSTFTPAQAFLRLVVYRDADNVADTYTADAWFLGLELQYTAAF